MDPRRLQQSANLGCGLGVKRLPDEEVRPLSCQGAAKPGLNAASPRNNPGKSEGMTLPYQS